MHATLADLREDLTDLLAIAESCEKRVLRHQNGLDRSNGSYRKETLAFLTAQTEQLRVAYRDLADPLRDALKKSGAWTMADAERLLRLKRESADLLRALQSNLAFVLSAGDWQSPSFLHSVTPQAGTQVGKIVGTRNDYKRDRHLDADAFEKAFAKEYLGSSPLFPLEAHLTSSGMAAFSTLVFHLRADRQVRGPILAGASIYFENKIVLEKAFPGQVRYVNESDADAVVEAARKLRPQAVFLDTLCNTDTLAVPDMPSIVPRLLAVLGKQTYLVVDNSGMALACQPADWLRTIGSAIRPVVKLETRTRLFVIESLNKYYQFGFDRVTGGIVWTPEEFAPSGIGKARVCLGTNMPDASVLAMPEPNRRLLRRRIERMGRNAQCLAERIDAYLDEHPDGPVSHVVYPGLPSHSSAAWAKTRWFHGSFLVLAFRHGRQDAKTYQKFVSLVIDKARRAGVDLVSGTSFGFDVTRIYLTALRATNVTRPFVRISAGTETSDEMEAIARVLITTIESL